MKPSQVPKTMSTQHPDNANTPFFSSQEELAGEDEIKEAFYIYSHLKCQEQLWDCEGKEVDNYVVKKLLTNYDNYFKRFKLGEDIFLTLRVPNPFIEKAEAKILLETLNSIPRNFDSATLFYGEKIAPIFEIAQPMTSNAKELIYISHYYKKHIIGQKKESINGMKIVDWIGDFEPESIRIIPLFEDYEGILNAASEVKKFIEAEKIEDYQRVWLARSDPALNYGSLSAILLDKIALQRLRDVQKETSIDILPILGCGSAPFRGNLHPENVKNILKGYPSVHTFTIQSAFKYDYPVDSVEKGVKELNELPRASPIPVDEKRCIALVDALTKEYQKQMLPLAPLINEISAFIPNRRKRKMHIGLFGYSRSISKVKLPRAIKFCGALYSLGIPPDLFGLNALSKKDLAYVHQIVPSYEKDLKDAMALLNRKNFMKLAPQVYKRIKPIIDSIKQEPDTKHEKITGIILENYEKRQSSILQENILRAGFVRRFLG